jgi:hypothetical protein
MMRCTKHPDGWWIDDVPTYVVGGEVCTSCGPYDTRAEADDDRRGLERFYKANPEYAAGEVVAVNVASTSVEVVSMHRPAKQGTLFD